MDQGKAKLLLQVDQLQSSLSFYVGVLGWEIIEIAGSGYAALLRVQGDQAIVLVQRGQSVEQEQEKEQEGQESYPKLWLHPKHDCPKVGDIIYIGVPSVDEVERILRLSGCSELRKEEEAGHIRKLFVPTVDGYILVYWEELSASNEEIIAMYAAGPDELECALDGLSDEQLSLKEASGKWSIREQVLHLIDLELVTIHKVKFALAEPGRFYQGNPFSQDDWCVGLEYAKRAIAPEVQLFRIVRQHILGLCEHLPVALERTVMTINREESVARLLKMMAGHATHHVRVVERIRKANGC